MCDSDWYEDRRLPERYICLVLYGCQLQIIVFSSVECTNLFF